MSERDVILDTLAEDGDTYEQADGTTLRLRIVPDETWCWDDMGDGWGRVAWVEHRRDMIHPDPRPEGFTGRARKLQLRDGAVWWEPWTDATDEQIADARRCLPDLLEYGASGIILERLDGVDAYGRPIVRDAVSLWGVELAACRTWQATRDVIRDVLGDLLYEMTEVAS